MNVVGRIGLIAVCLVALSVPAGELCAALGDRMGDCHAQMSGHDMSGHQMPGCDDELAVAPACCEASSGEALPESILKRPYDDELTLAAVAGRTGLESLSADSLSFGIERLEPPPRPPRHALFSTLLL